METFTRDGLTFDVRDSGPADGEAVVLLHGFPESSTSWDHVLPGLNGGGYRTLAPDQRGYSSRARPRGIRSYKIATLADDVLALADQAEIGRFHLVGHDWGGGVAWQLAASHPDRLRSLTSLSTPHPRAMTTAMVRSDQALRSWYMLAFQIPRLPERLMLADEGRRLRKALADSGLSEPYLGTYVRAMLEPGALTAALNWYRAVPLGAREGRHLGPITVPTLYVWSTGDTALGRAAAERTAAQVTARYRFEVLDEVSHWIPEERPGTVVTMLLDHLQGD